MWTPATLTDGTRTNYGFGWSIDSMDGRRLLTHGGSLPGFSSDIARFPDDSMTVVVLTNLYEADAGEISDGIARLLFARRNR
jgi:hypothetical protein